MTNQLIDSDLLSHQSLPYLKRSCLEFCTTVTLAKDKISSVNQRMSLMLGSNSPPGGNTSTLGGVRQG